MGPTKFVVSVAALVAVRYITINYFLFFWLHRNTVDDISDSSTSILVQSGTGISRSKKGPINSRGRK